MRLFPLTVEDAQRMVANARRFAAENDAAAERRKRRVEMFRRFAAEDRAAAGVDGERYCPDCNGTGETSPPSPNHYLEAADRCDRCRGFGVV